ncbi:MAG: hypothetical protein SO093_03820, partial [Desulfovibrio sp.]|uniref:hypothetical protein n=1 Tax=Desulfovibrio sp. TaxID=885 RepID=UPI002A834172
TGQGEARYVPTAHQAHHENLFVSWDEITTPFKIKKHAGHPLMKISKKNYNALISRVIPHLNFTIKSSIKYYIAILIHYS